MFSEQESPQDSEAHKAQHKPSEPKFNSEMCLFGTEPAIWILTLGTAQGMHGRDCISLCHWVGCLHRVAGVLNCGAMSWILSWMLPGCRAQGWRAVISGHTIFTHPALVFSGETAKCLSLSLSCSDPVNEVTESPVLNPLEAMFSLVLYSYMQLSFEKAVRCAADLWDVNEE